MCVLAACLLLYYKHMVRDESMAGDGVEAFIPHSTKGSFVDCEKGENCFQPRRDVTRVYCRM